MIDPEDFVPTPTSVALDVAGAVLPPGVRVAGKGLKALKALKGANAAERLAANLLKADDIIQTGMSESPRIPANLATEIKELLANSDYDLHGLRIVTDAQRLDPRLTRKLKKLRVGEEAPASWEWVDGMPTKRRLPGASAVKLDDYAVAHTDADLAARIEKGLQRVSGYTGDQLVLLGTKERFWPGNDPSEIVMQRPLVIGSWQLGPKTK